MSNRHLGSEFDEFLAEENLLERAMTVATKRVMAARLAEPSISVPSPENGRDEGRRKRKPGTRLS